MRSSAKAGNAVVLAALAVALAGCAGLARPGNELWPYGYGTAGPPATPTRPATVEPRIIEGPENTVIYEGTLDGRQVPFLANRSSRDLTVVYQTESGNLQTVVVPAGTSIALGEPAQRIVEVR